MRTKVTLDRMLRVVSKAWGEQDGYCFFPYIDRQRQVDTGLRNAGYHEGPNRPKTDERGSSFKWPEDRPEIISHLRDNLAKGHDVYWCPSLFEYPQRRSSYAMDEHALWADLDEVDPTKLDLEPTIAWESSPERYQALWLASEGDFQGASWPGNENQRLTYSIGADQSGWDTTQLLRLPGWPNFKPERIEANGGVAPLGKLLWTTGPSYSVSDFHTLPEVKGAIVSELTEALEAEVEAVDKFKALARIRVKLNHTARELLNAREISGDRSSNMWYLMRCLADAGATVTEVVAIVRPTVWNKFANRADEMKRLINEASKAVASRSEETVQELEYEEERKVPTRLGDLLRNIKRPVWLIESVLTEGACGFIAGEPKTWKSWLGYDMAMSVATGADFLGYFRVANPGPVLYIQEEDPLPVLKTRGAKIWQGKSVDKLELDSEGGIFWLPSKAERAFDPDINAYVQQGVTLSEEAWILWLDETLEEGMKMADGHMEPYRLMIIDTLMMTAGAVDENRAQEMTTKIFRPLKTLSRKHNCAIQVVHHLGKTDKARMGQRMLGSVANHAWGEDSLYLLRSGKDRVKMEMESKVAPGMTWAITNLENSTWQPAISPWSASEKSENYRSTPDEGRGGQGKPSGSAGRGSKAVQALEIMGGIKSTKEVEDEAKLSYQQAYRQLQRAVTAGKVRKIGTGQWTMS